MPGGHLLDTFSSPSSSSASQPNMGFCRRPTLYVIWVWVVLGFFHLLDTPISISIVWFAATRARGGQTDRVTNTPFTRTRTRSDLGGRFYFDKGFFFFHLFLFFFF